MTYAMIPYIKKVRVNGPYALAGFCSGGVLAMKIAKQLINSGNEVSFLGLIDTSAPSEISFTETEIFSTYLGYKFPDSVDFCDSVWETHMKIAKQQ